MSAKIGVNTFVWHSPLRDAELAELVPRIAGWGFELVELVLENPGDWSPALAADLLTQHGITPAVSAVMSAGRNLVAAPDHEVEATQDYLRHCIEVATQIGASVVGGPLSTEVGRTWRTTREERATLVSDLREALRPLADTAGEAGVMLAIEPLNRYEASLITTVDDVLDVIDGLPAESVGVLFDTYHANIEERDPAASLAAAGDRLAAMQVCGNDRGAPGSDHIEWDALGAVLGEIGYSGGMSIESFTADNETIATAASIWRPLAESQDELATEGLAFLRDWRATWQHRD